MQMFSSCFVVPYGIRNTLIFSLAWLTRVVRTKGHQHMMVFCFLIYKIPCILTECVIYYTRHTGKGGAISLCWKTFTWSSPSFPHCIWCTGYTGIIIKCWTLHRIGIHSYSAVLREERRQARGEVVNLLCHQNRSNLFSNRLWFCPSFNINFSGLCGFKNIPHLRRYVYSNLRSEWGMFFFLPHPIKIFSSFFEKPIDKASSMCYNIVTTKTQSQ